MDSNDELLRRVQRSDMEALDQLIRVLHDRVFRMASRVAADRSLAEDATAEVFYKVWRRARQWSQQSSAETWILRIAATTVLDLARKRRRWWLRQNRSTKPEADPAPGPEEQLAAHERRRAVHKAIEQLAPPDRLLVHLFYFDGQTLPEIGAIMGVSPDALKMRLMRARQSLGRLLGDV